MKLMVILLLLSTNALADAANGEKLYSKCISCHGKDAMGKASQKAPMLAGQYDWYIVSQMKAIRDKTRTAGQVGKMYPFVKNLSDQDIKDIAEYVSALDKKKGE